MTRVNNRKMIALGLLTILFDYCISVLFVYLEYDDFAIVYTMQTYSKYNSILYWKCINSFSVNNK